MSTPVRSTINKGGTHPQTQQLARRTSAISKGHLHKPPEGFAQSAGIILRQGQSVFSITGTNMGEAPRVRHLKFCDSGKWQCEPTTGASGCVNLENAAAHGGTCVHIRNFTTGSTKYGGTFFKWDEE